jgi:hypothetical protein
MTEEITRNSLEDKPLPPRGERDLAPEDQIIAFIVVDRSYVRHRTYEKAKQERDYIKAKTGKMMRVLKIVQCDLEDLKDGKVTVFREGAQFILPE